MKKVKNFKNKQLLVKSDMEKNQENCNIAINKSFQILNKLARNFHMLEALKNLLKIDSSQFIEEEYSSQEILKCMQIVQSTLKARQNLDNNDIYFYL